MRLVIAESSADVAQGQYAEVFVCRFQVEHRCCRDEVADHVPVREHHPLGFAGGAGGIDEGCKVIGFDQFLYLLHLLFRFGGAIPPLFNYIEPVGGAVDLIKGECGA